MKPVDERCGHHDGTGPPAAAPLAPGRAAPPRPARPTAASAPRRRCRAKGDGVAVRRPAAPPGRPGGPGPRPRAEPAHGHGRRRRALRRRRQREHPGLARAARDARRAGGGGGNSASAPPPRPRSWPAPRPTRPPRRAAAPPGRGSAGARPAPPATPPGRRSGSEVLVGVDVGEPRLHPVEGLTLGQPLPLRRPPGLAGHQGRRPRPCTSAVGTSSRQPKKRPRRGRSTSAGR